MLNLSLDELKAVAKIRGIKGYKSMSKECQKYLGNQKQKQKQVFLKREQKTSKKILIRDRFLKQKIKEIGRNYYEIKNKKNLSKSKIKEIEQILLN